MTNYSFYINYSEYFNYSHLFPFSPNYFHLFHCSICSKSRQFFQLIIFNLSIPIIPIIPIIYFQINYAIY